MGSNITIGVIASGRGPLTYQWYSDQTGSTVQPLSHLQSFSVIVNQTSNFWVLVTNPAGTVSSDTVQIIVPNSPLASSLPNIGSSLQTNGFETISSDQDNTDFKVGLATVSESSISIPIWNLLVASIFLSLLA